MVEPWFKRRAEHRPSRSLIALLLNNGPQLVSSAARAVVDLDPAYGTSMYQAL